MTTPRNRADDHLAAWTTATDRPIPAFAGRSSRRQGTGRRVVLTAVVVLVLVGLVVGAVLTGGRNQKPTLESAPSAELALGAARALATAPGVRYALTVAVTEGGMNEGLRSVGQIDLVEDRFAGTADAGPGGQSMLMFGGPSSGAVVKAGGMFVQTEGGPWVRSEANPQFDALTNRAVVSQAFVTALGPSEVDPAIRTAPCGTMTCRLIAVTMPRAALFALERAVFGDAIGEPPADLGPVVVQALIDPTSGFLIGLETQTTAGTTTIHITLGLTRLDPAPAISPPIP